MTSRSRLGHGVDALLSEQNRSDDSPESNGNTLLDIALDQLRPSPFQPRTDFDPEAIRTLADSLKESGAIQPIVVRRVGKLYELIAGERRLRAAREAGFESLPAIVRDMSDDEAATLTLIENIQREDLNPIDEAKALERLAYQMNCTHEEVAERVGRARATVSNLIRLLQLHAEVQKRIVDGSLSMGHARVLVPLNPTLQKQLANEIVRRGLSVRQTERLAKQKSANGKETPEKTEDPDVLRLQQKLSDLVGCSVTLRPRRDGGGQLVMSYSGQESLQGILQKLGYSED